MESVLHFFFLLPLALLSLSLLSNPCEARSSSLDLITRTCNSVAYKDLCLATLRSQEEGAKTNLKGLAAITIQFSMATASTNSDQIIKLLNTTTDPVIQDTLSDCSESYVDAIDQLVDSLSVLDTQNYSDANKALAAAIDSVELCEEGFTSESGNVTEIRKNNKKFTHLCSNALSISKQLAASGYAH